MAKWTGWVLVVLSVGLIMLSFTPGQTGPGGPVGPGLDPLGDGTVTSTTTTTTTSTTQPANGESEKENLARGVITLRFVAAGGLAVGGILVWVALVLDKKNHAKLKSRFQQNPRWKRGRSAARSGDTDEESGAGAEADDSGPDEPGV